VEMMMPDGARGTVELSRTRSLANRTQVWAERGSVEIPLYGDRVVLHMSGAGFPLAGQAQAAPTPGEQDLPSVMGDQLCDFARSIAGQPAPILTGAESRRSLALIESCYRVAKPLPEPWSASLSLA